MRLKKILVYDNNNTFPKFLKSVFGEKFEINVYKNFNNDYNFDDMLKEYATIVFVIYSEMDLFDFIKIYDKGIPIIVCSFKNEILTKFKTLKNINLLDGTMTKQEIMNYFQNTLRIHADMFGKTITLK